MNDVPMTGKEYHEAAMRTAAGPEVMHVPEDPVEFEAYDDELIEDVINFILAAHKLDRHKSIMFYNKDKSKIGMPELLRAYNLSDAKELFEGMFSVSHIPNPQLIHAILGIASEAGEITADLLVAMTGEVWTVYGNDHGNGMASNVKNMSRESGDIDWYQELLATAIKHPVDASRVENIERLRKRFPDKFTEADAIERKDEA